MKIYRYKEKLPLRRMFSCLGFCFGVIVAAAAAAIFIFGGTILNGYVKVKVERAFAEAHPGCLLRIGELGYALITNRIDARSVILNTTNFTIKAGRVSVTGVRWAQFLREKAALPDFFARAGVDAGNIDVKFHRAHYGIRCVRLRASVPGSELIAEEIEVLPLIGDEEIFAAGAFRTTRFHVIVPECRVLGIDYGELLKGKSYRARAVHLSGLSFDALVNRDKPVKPLVKSPLMAHEALAAISKPLRIDSLNISNGYVKYSERVVAGAAPGVLTFTAVNISAENIANRGNAPAVIRLKVRGNIMNAGLLNVLMTIPVNSPGFSLKYSGSLDAVDLTRLNAFLDIAEHTRIKSGNLQKLTFEIDVTKGHARGHVRANYKDFTIAVLDKQNGTEKGLDNRFATFFANAFKIRSSTARNASGAIKSGKVKYTKKPGEEFMQFLWYALRSGVLDVIYR